MSTYIIVWIHEGSCLEIVIKFKRRVWLESHELESFRRDRQNLSAIAREKKKKEKKSTWSVSKRFDS